METRAQLKYLRLSPRKVRLVADLARGLDLINAIDQLSHSKKRAAKPLIKLLMSAAANAKHNHEIERDNLRIKELRIEDGPTLHRWMPRAHGRATPIRKRTSHIFMVLEEIKPGTGGRKKARPVEAPVKLEAKPPSEEGVKVSGQPADAEPAPEQKEKGKVITDPREEGRGKHTKIEGRSHRGFASRIFRRKSG